MTRQLTLFDPQAIMICDRSVVILSQNGADVRLYESIFDLETRDRYWTHLLSDTRWQQDYLPIYDKQIPLPRLTAWYGDPDKAYSYSGIEMQPNPWTATLLEIRARVETIANRRFNSVLLNLYRHGKDGVAWHSDDESQLGTQPAIASVSFGATRRFSFKHKYRKDLKPIHLDLTSGSLLLMQGNTQHDWLHQVPKTAKPVEPRINLTFRTIVEGD